MRTLPLDPDTLAVTTFDPTPAERAAALGADTIDEVCYCLSLLAEDCFGPTAGCSNSDTEQA